MVLSCTKKLDGGSKSAHWRSSQYNKKHGALETEYSLRWENIWSVTLVIRIETCETERSIALYLKRIISAGTLNLQVKGSWISLKCGTWHFLFIDFFFPPDLERTSCACSFHVIKSHDSGRGWPNSHPQPRPGSNWSKCMICVRQNLSKSPPLKQLHRSAQFNSALLSTAPTSSLRELWLMWEFLNQGVHHFLVFPPKIPHKGIILMLDTRSRKD